jgi:hypothetical protein
MNVRMTCSAVALAIAASFGMASPATAQPNCPTCLKGYQQCLASGVTTCDTTYAVCLSFCPLPLAAAPPVLRGRHVDPAKQQRSPLDDSPRVASR